MSRTPSCGSRPVPPSQSLGRHAHAIPSPMHSCPNVGGLFSCPSHLLGFLHDEALCRLASDLHDSNWMAVVELQWGSGSSHGVVVVVVVVVGGCGGCCGCCGRGHLDKMCMSTSHQANGQPEPSMTNNCWCVRKESHESRDSTIKWAKSEKHKVWNVFTLRNAFGLSRTDQ